MKTKHNYICALFVLFCIHTAQAKEETWSCDSVSVPEGYRSSPKQEGNDLMYISEIGPIIFSYDVQMSTAGTNIGADRTATYNKFAAPFAYISGPFMGSALVFYEIKVDLSQINAYLSKKAPPPWNIRFLRDKSNPKSGFDDQSDWQPLQNCKKVKK
jgi:hypothetical protein